MNLSKARQVSRIVVGLLLNAPLATTGYGQNPAGQNVPWQPTPTNPCPTSSSPKRVVLKVANEEMTPTDIDMNLEGMQMQEKRALEAQGCKAVGYHFALIILLSQRAVNDHLDTSPDVVSNTHKLTELVKSAHVPAAEAEQQLAIARRRWLAEAEYKRLVDQTKATPEEVNQYYAAHPNDFIVAEVRQFTIGKRLEGAPDPHRGLPAQEARARMEEIRKAVRAGTDPQKLADQFQVHNAVFIDVTPKDVRRTDLFLPEMGRQVFQLRDGALTEVFDTFLAWTCYQVLGQRRLELKEVGSEVENIVQKEKLQALLLRKKANIWMDDAYFALPPPKLAAPGPNTPSGTPPSKP